MTSAPPPELRQLKLFDQNLRSTTLGVNFTKKLFTDPTSITARDALKVMKTLGLELPAEFDWTIDALQIYISGQALYSGVSGGYQAASSALEVAKISGDTKAIAQASKGLNASVNATGAAAHLLTNFAQSNWGMDADTASITHIGTDIAMIVASGGANVQAWISLAINVASIPAAKQGEADMKAARALLNSGIQTLGDQHNVFQRYFKTFQDGNMSIYDLIVKAALDAPDIFPQLIKPDSALVQSFPGLQLLPVVPGAFVGRGESAIKGDIPFNGSYVIASWSRTYTVPRLTLSNYDNIEVMADRLFTALLKPHAILYLLAGYEAKAKNKAAMNHIAMLTYLYSGETGTISSTEDYVQYLYNSMLTPYDFGDNILDKISDDFILKNFNYKIPTYFEQAVSIGNSTKRTEFDLYNDEVLKYSKILKEVADSGKIEKYVNTPEIYSVLRQYLTYETTEFEKDPSLLAQLGYLVEMDRIKSWRHLGNYFAVLNMIEQFRTDSRLQRTKWSDEISFMFGTYGYFEKDFKRLQQLSYGRAVNQLAEKNIAGFLDTTPDNLVYKTPKNGTYEGPVMLDVKG